MPNVPNLPGVPQLVDYITNQVVFLAEDIFSDIFGFLGPEWGIFLDGVPALPYNAVIDFDYKQDWPVSDYPVEDGGFQSYDKVQLPFDIRIRVASGGSDLERQALLDAIEDAANTLDLFDVVTPEKTYSSCNITHYDYRRASHAGVGVIVLDIWLVEIRITSTSTFSSTKNPTTSGQQNTGAVTTQPPSQAIQQGFGDGTYQVE
jgi:hypothetical protein